MRTSFLLTALVVVLVGCVSVAYAGPCVSVTLDGTPVPLSEKDVETLQKDVWKAIVGSLGVVGGASGVALAVARGHPYIGVATATLTVASGLVGFKLVEVNVPVVDGPCPVLGPPPDPIPIPEPDPLACNSPNYINQFASLPAAWWACWHADCPAEAGSEDAWSGRFNSLFCAEAWSTGPRPIQ